MQIALKSRMAAFCVAGWSILAVGVSTSAHADSNTPVGGEIIVTAQKREQAVNTVPMTIVVATQDELRMRRIESVEDLPRLVPSLTIQHSDYNSTSITLRGVGFFNSDLATPPAVTIYLDEAPLPYPAMTRLAAFDLDRVEVLEGPQGTLFGQNATGGAVNYIAAKPTAALTSGLDASYGRFNRTQLSGFVSGTLAKDLTGRLALAGNWGDGWQISTTRSNDRLGRIRTFQGRATFEWQPSNRFSSRLSLTLTHDGSDSLAAQFVGSRVTFPALAVPGLLDFPVIKTPRAADWTPSRLDNGNPFPYANDTTFLQASWRNDLPLGDGVTLTSLSSFAYLHMAYGQDTDGTPYNLTAGIDTKGRVSAFFQELRLAGTQDHLTWLVGANYDHDVVSDRPQQFFGEDDTSQLFLAIDPQARADVIEIPNRLRLNTYALFAHAGLRLADQLNLEAAIRYTRDERTFDICEVAGSDHFARYWNFFRGGAQPPTKAGDCFTLDSANGLRPVDNVHRVLNQSNVPWRVGLSWTPRPALLFFATVSRGYKAGAVLMSGGATTAQYQTVTQESLLSYEAGFKAGFLGGRLQLNSSAFYYDYDDKQLMGELLDPVFGPVQALVSIPRSHAQGVEAQLVAHPIEGLTIDAAATYVETRVDRFTGYDALGAFGDQAGTPFPFAPKWHVVSDVQYSFSVGREAKAFMGGSLTYSSATYAGVGARDILRIAPFTLLDLRAGVEFAAGRYRIWVWGRNVGNSYYWNNVFAYGNTISRFVGDPATYGLSLSGRF